MKRTLNPDLVNATPPRGTRFHDAEQWVILREPKDTGLGKENGIGSVEIDMIDETGADIAGFKQQLRETENALTALSGCDSTRLPQVFLTKDCFDLEGPVRLLIYSDKPFAPKRRADDDTYEAA